MAKASIIATMLPVWDTCMRVIFAYYWARPGGELALALFGGAWILGAIGAVNWVLQPLDDAGDDNEHTCMVMLLLATMLLVSEATMDERWPNVLKLRAIASGIGIAD